MALATPTTSAITGADVERALADADAHLETILAAARVGESHGIGHARDVLDINRRALDARRGPLSAENRLASCLAALLHDADDYKYFPSHHAYENARAVLARVAPGGRALSREATELVVRMVSWVSASANGDAVPPEAEDWMLYPRYADRLAGLGWKGVYRCWRYTEEVDRPLFTATTARATDEADLWARVASPERYAAYRGGSASMIDHYYDKLLHIGWQVAAQDNEYLRTEAMGRTAALVEVALEFGRTGGISAATYARAQSAAAPAAKKPGDGAD